MSKYNPRNMKVGQLVKTAHALGDEAFKGDLALIVRDISEIRGEVWAIEILVGDRLIKADYAELEPL